MRLLVCLVVILAAACGKKGPPLAPFVRVPAAVSGATFQRVGADVYLQFPVPSTNADGQQPADIAAVEVYAVTAVRPPATEEQRDVAALVATLPVRPILPELPPVDGVAPPPLPVPPGVDRGATAVVRETLSPETLVPVTLPEDPGQRRQAPIAEAEIELFGPLVAPAPSDAPRRHYFLIGVSPRGRKSDPSPPVSVPLETGASAPSAPVVDYTATQMTLKWTPPKDARASIFMVPAAPKPPVTTTPDDAPAKPALAPLQARSLGFTTEATTYHVFAVPADRPAEDPYAIAVPTPITPQPLAATEHVVTGVTFGVETCFEVRPVDQIAGVAVLGPASPRTCVTPADTFPPVAPRSLAVIAGTGVINLVWDANAEADLAGYLVLRAEAPGDTLQALTAEPVTATTYRDERVEPGRRYVYAVVAVDRAGNRSPESNRVEETAR